MTETIDIRVLKFRKRREQATHEINRTYDTYRGEVHGLDAKYLTKLKAIIYVPITLVNKPTELLLGLPQFKKNAAIQALRHQYYIEKAQIRKEMLIKKNKIETAFKKEEYSFDLNLLSGV
jgi:hypothetical protein